MAQMFIISSIVCMWRCFPFVWFCKCAAAAYACGGGPGYSAGSPAQAFPCRLVAGGTAYVHPARCPLAGKVRPVGVFAGRDGVRVHRGVQQQHGAGNLAVAADAALPGAGLGYVPLLRVEDSAGHALQRPQPALRGNVVFCGAVGVFQRSEHLVDRPLRCIAGRQGCAAAPRRQGTAALRRADAGAGGGTPRCGHRRAQSFR